MKAFFFHEGFGATHASPGNPVEFMKSEDDSKLHVVLLYKLNMLYLSKTSNAQGDKRVQISVPLICLCYSVCYIMLYVITSKCCFCMRADSGMIVDLKPKND